MVNLKTFEEIDELEDWEEMIDINILNSPIALSYTNLALEASASSCRYGVIELHELDGIHISRANLHACLIMPFGSGKTSTIVRSFQENKVFKKYLNEIKSLTAAGLVGTIDKDGNISQGQIKNSAGKLVVLDEFQDIDYKVMTNFNSLLEYPHQFEKAISYSIKKPINQKGKFYYVRGKQGESKIEVYSKFSCIANGMYINKTTSVGKAFFSRFLPIRLMPSEDYYGDFIRGKAPIKINPRIDEIKSFIHEDYLTLCDIFMDKFKRYKYFKENKEELGYSTRLITDIARLSDYIALKDQYGDNPIKKDTSINVLKKDYIMAMKYFDPIMSSYIYYDFDEKDLKIIEMSSNHSITDISSELNIDKATIYRRINRILNRGINLGIAKEELKGIENEESGSKGWADMGKDKNVA